LLTDFDAADTLISLASNLQINIIQPYATLSTKDLVSMKSLGFQIFMPRAVGSDDDLRDLDSYRQAVSLVILDSKVTGELGGSGKSFDHDLFLTARNYAPSLKLALAGGLTPDNVADATRKCEPYMLDVSSGVESKPGIKSLTKMRDFIAASRI
jgi:phosphoribosylanthranilate isomerase